MSRVFENYIKVLRWRLRLWLDEEPELEVVGISALVVKQAGVCVGLTFLPKSCEWQLDCGEDRLCGNFDRLSKRMRQLLTTSLCEEEA